MLSGSTDFGARLAEVAKCDTDRFVEVSTNRSEADLRISGSLGMGTSVSPAQGASPNPVLSLKKGASGVSLFFGGVPRSGWF